MILAASSVSLNHSSSPPIYPSPSEILSRQKRNYDSSSHRLPSPPPRQHTRSSSSSSSSSPSPSVLSDSSYDSDKSYDYSDVVVKQIKIKQQEQVSSSKIYPAPDPHQDETEAEDEEDDNDNDEDDDRNDHTADKPSLASSASHSENNDFHPNHLTTRAIALSSSHPLTPTHIVFLSVVAILIVVFNVIYNVSSQYLNLYLLSPYSFLLGQMIQFSTVIFQIPVFSYLVYFGYITKQEISCVSFKTIFWMGFIDSMFNMFISMGNSYTPPCWQNLIQQFSIPYICIITMIWLKKIFKINHYLGGGVMFIGCVVSSIGLIYAGFGPNPLFPFKTVSVCFYAFGILLYSINMVNKEIQLKSTMVSIWYLCLMDSLVNFMLNFILIPLLWVPGIGSDNTESPSSTFDNFYNGLLCWFTKENEDLEDNPYAQCSNVYWMGIINGLSNVGVLICTFLLLRHASAYHMEVVSGLMLPFTNLSTSSSVIINTVWLLQPMDEYMWYGVAICLLGMLIFILPFDYHCDRKIDFLAGTVWSVWREEMKNSNSKNQTPKNSNSPMFSFSSSPSLPTAFKQSSSTSSSSSRIPLSPLNSHEIDRSTSFQPSASQILLAHQHQ